MLADGLGTQTQYEGNYYRDFCSRTGSSQLEADSTQYREEPERRGIEANIEGLCCDFRYLRPNGGEGGIRTLGTVTGTPHFECGTIDHSATSPRGEPLGFGLARARPGGVVRAALSG